MSTKFEPERAKEAQEFIEQTTGDSFKGEFQESLKNGVLLCKLLNSLQPGTVPNIHTGNMAFKKMENIAAYVAGSKKLGVPDEYNFVTVDLYEGKNLAQVVQNVIALKRAQGHGFNKGSKPQVEIKMNKDDQTTESKSQKNMIGREPKNVNSENEVSRTGPALMSGRHNNVTAMNCPVCTKSITSGSVNALGKSFHPNCFTCKKCDVKLSTAKYYEHDGYAYCDRCILIVKPQNSVKGTTKDVKGFKF